MTTDIDKLALELIDNLADESFYLDGAEYLNRGVATDLVKSALAAYGDECSAT